MFERMKRVAVLLAVGAAFSSGVWGQALEHHVDHSKALAAEFFGAPDGRLVKARSENNRPTKVVISLYWSPISGGNEANLTYSLAGATFAGRVSLSQFEAEDEDVSLSLVEGGQEGDSEVTVSVSVASDGFWVQSGGDIIFTFPDLQVTPVVLDPETVTLGLNALDPEVVTRGAAVDVSIEVTTSTGTSFPDVIGFAPGGDETGDQGPEVIYDIVPALNIAWGEDIGTGEVDLMNRKVLTGANEMMPTGSLNLGTLTAAEISENYAQAARPRGLMDDGGPDDPVGLDDFAGKLVVTATGNFQTDDKVMLGEAELTRSEDGGSYSGEIAIADAESGVAVTYHPGGVDDLLPATFNATARVQYDDPLNASGAVEGQGTATIEYAGISLAAYAHGIVKAGGAATTYLRVACAGATDCSLFASCRDQSGGSHFGELGVVAAGGLEVYDSGEIGEALDGGWGTGRGRCDLLSDGVLEVQNMLNQGSANVNNSLVTNGAGILRKEQ